MRLIKSISIIFGLIPFASTAQTLVDILDPTTTTSTLLNRTRGTVGDLYLFKQFMNADLFLHSKQAPLPVLLNIDSYGHEVVVVLDSKEQVIDKRLVKSMKIRISEDSIATFEPIGNDVLLFIYKNELNDVRLYKRFGKKIVKGTEGNGYTEATKDKLVDTEDYLLRKESKSIMFDTVKELLKGINEKWPEKSIDTDFKKSKVKSEFGKLVFMINQL
jgi:hypothetical protein